MRLARPLLLAFVLVLAACGGSSTGSSSTDVNLSATGASPAQIAIASGGQVRFVNNDSVDHTMTSTDCSELTSPRLAHGQTFSKALLGPKTCSYSDGLNPTVTSFKGTVSVAAPGAGGGGGGGGSGY